MNVKNVKSENVENNETNRNQVTEEATNEASLTNQAQNACTSYEKFETSNSSPNPTPSGQQNVSSTNASNEIARDTQGQSQVKHLVLKHLIIETLKNTDAPLKMCSFKLHFNSQNRIWI